MEILLLGIYSFFVWLIFIKFKWLPWNMTSKVIVVTLPIIGLTLLILLLNIVAPSSHDVRVMNYSVAILPRVTGRVISVPIEPNRPLKKGDILFVIDPVPFQMQVDAAEAKLVEAKSKVAAAEGYERELGDELKAAEAKTKGFEARIPEYTAKLASAVSYEKELQEALSAAIGKRVAVESKQALAKQRADQYKELVKGGAGTRFDLEQAEADLKSIDAELESAKAAESQAKVKLAARTDTGELSEIAQAKAMLAQAKADVITSQAAESQVKQKLNSRTEDGVLTELAQARAQVKQFESALAMAKWDLDQTIVRAPADGTVVNLALREGSVASQLIFQPVMTFVENEQWVVAFYHQNELRDVKPGDEGEIAVETYPGRIIKCEVDSIVWATGQGTLPIAGLMPDTGSAPPPEGRIAVRMKIAEQDKDLFLAAGAHRQGAIYTEHGEAIHILRKVIVRVGSKLDWLILKLH